LVEWRELGPVQLVSDCLVRLYPSEWSTRRLLRMAGVDSARIPFDSIAANVSFFAALEAARQGRLKELVAVMVEEYPLDEWVMVLNAKLRGRAEA
jgi:hypothetical protein